MQDLCTAYLCSMLRHTPESRVTLLVVVNRVYLIGGASATGNDNDTVVVYTPSTLGNQRGWGVLSMENHTLPHGSYLSTLTHIPQPQGA
jgi:hypothetical protein